VAATRAVRLWAPVAVWAALVFALSSIPSLSTGLGLWDTILRKCAHTVEYAVLGALLLRTRIAWPAALALGIAYAASDEVHQGFVRGRHSSPVDVGIDTIGLALGILVASRASSWAR
jgi:VanZ family protein